MVFQTWALFPHLTVARNIEFGLRLRRVDAAMRKRRVGELLDLVGLSALAERMPRQLSGGQQQRVALARALVTNPRVLLLDEPMSSLDFNTRTQLRQELRALQREVGVTAIYVTHDYSEALAVADRTVLMHDGVIVEQAQTRALFERPGTRFAAEFLNLHNVLQGEIVAASEAGVRIRLSDAATVSVPGNAFADGVPLPGTRIALGFDQWSADFREGEAAACALGGCVEQTAIESGHTRFAIRLDGGLGLFNVRRPGLSELPKGTRCAVTLDGTKSWPLRD
jgi:ABC-type Fe3+/spermidine/putrescine transport system ATPase subunit